MDAGEFGEWRPMASAPRDGSRVLVAIRGTEQGAAEVDVARWAKPDRSGEECWIAADSDPGALVVYAEAELVSWMPMPAPQPHFRSRTERQAQAKRLDVDEIGGSGI